MCVGDAGFFRRSCAFFIILRNLRGGGFLELLAEKSIDVVDDNGKK